MSTSSANDISARLKYRSLVSGLNRRQTSLLTQLRTGHAPLNHHLHKIGAWETPFCMHCKTKRETVYHYIMTCDAYRDQRLQLRRDRGVNILYLLPYTPNFNPNEECFSFMNSYVRQNGIRLRAEIDSGHKDKPFSFLYETISQVSESHVKGGVQPFWDMYMPTPTENAECWCVHPANRLVKGMGRLLYI